MTAYRKIKIFKFSDFLSYEDCQESANDYYAELSQYSIEAMVTFTVDFIAVILPIKQDLKFKIQGKDLVGVMKKNN